MELWFAGASGLLALVITGCLPLLAQTQLANRATIEVPFEFIRGAIIVQAAVNSTGPVSMMVDTGADPSIIELGTARRAGLTIAASGQAGSGGGTTANLAYDTTLGVVKVGGLTATHVAAAAMDLSKISSALGRPIGGVLGQSLLKNRIVQIDYPNRKLRFLGIAPACPKAAPSHPPTCATLTFRYRDDLLAAGVKVNGKPVTTNIDTGSNANFELTPAAVNRLGLSDEVARAEESSSVGFNGVLKNHKGKLRTVAVDTISVNDAAVVFFGKGMGVDKEPWDLRIGNAFMKDFVVTVDYRHGQITLAQDNAAHIQSRESPSP